MSRLFNLELARSERTDYSDAKSAVLQRCWHSLELVKNQSPVIFWLLLSATLSVDAVAIYWVHLDGTAPNVGVLFESLCFSQLSVVAIWTVFAARNQATAAAVLAGTTLLAAAITGWFFEIPLAEMLAFLGTDVTLIVIFLWILKHTKWWQRALPSRLQTWQFSVGHLLALMTIVAVLVTLFQRGEILRTIPFAVAADLAMNCGLALAAVFVWGKLWRLPIRLTLIVGIAVLFGFAGWGSVLWFGNPTNPSGDELLQSLAGGIIQILVIIVWMELGQIIPPATNGDGHDDATLA